MPLNLITDAWLPVRLRDGSRKIIRPAQMAELLGTAQEVVAPDWPRPDLNVATYELLIGLLQVAFAPRDTKNWHRLYVNPPGVDELEATRYEKTSTNFMAMIKLAAVRIWCAFYESAA